VRGTAAPIVTESPDEPAGHVPIGGWSSAKARGEKPGIIATPAIPAPTISVWRRVQWRFANSVILYLPSEPAVDRRFPVLSEKEDFPGRAIASGAHSTLRGNHRICTSAESTRQ